MSDGDTLWVRPPQGGAPRAVRLEGIDAPELCQRHGPAARKALEQRALHRTVRVATRGKDDYRRSLARVSLGGDDLGRWMVAQGHAWAHRWRGKTTAYSQQEARARLARRGLFADAKPELPRDFRKRHGACR